MYIASVITIVQSWKLIKCTLIDNLAETHYISITLIKYNLKHILNVL